MKIKKTGYFISILIYIANIIISNICKLETRDTWWALLGVFIIITPSFIQTIYNIKYNRNVNGVVILYIVLGLLGLLYITGILILILLLFGIVEISLYWYIWIIGGAIYGVIKLKSSKTNSYLIHSCQVNSFKLLCWYRNSSNKKYVR